MDTKVIERLKAKFTKGDAGQDKVKTKKAVAKSAVSDRAQKVIAATFGAFLFGGGYLYWQESNIQRPDFDQIAFEVQQAKGDLLAIEKMAVLPDVDKQWVLAQGLSTQLGVELAALEDGSLYGVDVGVVDGGHVWLGTLKGSPKDVLFAAMSLQKAMPLILGDAAFDNGEAVMAVGVLGAPPRKINKY